MPQDIWFIQKENFLWPGKISWEEEDHSLTIEHFSWTCDCGINGFNSSKIKLESLIDASIELSNYANWPSTCECHRYQIEPTDLDKFRELIDMIERQECSS